jgi:hypothetical protein
MKTLLKTLLSTSLFMGVTGSALASENGYTFDQSQLVPKGARIEVGTTGYGGAFIWTPSPKVDIVLGYNGGDISWSDDVSVDGTKYDADMDNNVTYLNAQIRPWENWFYVAGGVAYVDSLYNLKARPGSNGEIKLDGKTYGADVGNVVGRLKYGNDIAPYAGLGFSPAINNRWGVFGEIGAYYTGNPSVNLYNTGNPNAMDVNNTTTAAQALENERNKLRNDDEYEWLPVAKLGLTVRW